jgi:hypothetical protein
MDKYRFIDRDAGKEVHGIKAGVGLCRCLSLNQPSSQ